MSIERDIILDLPGLLKQARPLDDLLSAKKESDRRNYPAKHDILRKLIKQSPGDFRIDSEEGNIYGITHIPTGFRIHMPRREAPSGLQKMPTQDDVYVQSAIPSSALAMVRKHGLLSSEALLSNPESMAALLAAHKDNPKGVTDEKVWRKRTEDNLKDDFWAPAMQGPSVFFGEPDPDKITDEHPTRRFPHQTVRVNLSKILRDQPKTRISGTELKPYDPEGPEAQGHLRHYDIDLAKVKEYAATDPKELWKNYDSPGGTHYASDVPHGFIITPSGSIAPEYLDFGDAPKPVLKQAATKQAGLPLPPTGNKTFRMLTANTPVEPYAQNFSSVGEYADELPSALVTRPSEGPLWKGDIGSTVESVLKRPLARREETTRHARSLRMIQSAIAKREGIDARNQSRSTAAQSQPATTTDSPWGAQKTGPVGTPQRPQAQGQGAAWDGRAGWFYDVMRRNPDEFELNSSTGAESTWTHKPTGMEYTVPDAPSSSTSFSASYG